MTQEKFKMVFHELTGNSPLKWQQRLFDQFMDSSGNLPSIIDLPTGIGKTMVMALWLIARSQVGSTLPRRLIYVVDRRTVVDQASDLARKLQCNFGKDKLVISTLRGQLADTREWSRDPSKLAIIIGTVDLIGSALLFSGYRSGYKERPLQAGLLGQDSLLLLDEAHLSKPFEKLITAIRFEQGKVEAQKGQALRAIRMSATTVGEDGECFKLDESDFDDPTIYERFNAKKTLIIEQKESVDAKLFAEKAIELANDSSQKGQRIVVFVRKPETASNIASLIRNHEIKTEDNTGKKPKTIKTMRYEASVEVLTGTMRGLERDELLDKPVLKRFLAADDPPNELRPCFLISTSAGEVGFDLNGDHMVCDLSTLDSLIQRLGRVNRRGGNDRAAKVVLLAEVPKPKLKDGKPQPLTPFEAASKETFNLLSHQANGSPLNVSPQAIAQLKILFSDRLDSACTPKPKMVELTDILLDAWSLTSIIEPMPGRPEVAPWIRGIESEPPQTTIAWRAELDIEGFNQLDIDDIEEWFDTHRVLTHETLSVPTSVTAKWLADRWNNLSDDAKAVIGDRTVVVDRAGLKLRKIRSVIAEVRRNPPNTDSIQNADLILPASFGGIQRHVGLLDPMWPKQPDKHALSGDDYKKAVEENIVVSDVADIRERYRKIEKKPDEGEPTEVPVGSGKMPEQSTYATLVIKLPSDDNDDVRRQLVSFVPKQDRLDFGSKRQTLSQHVHLVRKYADEIIKHLELKPHDTVRQAFELAADWHDHGKNRGRWQRLVKGEATPPGQKWKNETVGKSGGAMLRDSLGYRHEFGSLREFIDEYKNGKLIGHDGKPITPEVFDLAMHLMATHHGRSRPHFRKGGFDPDAEFRSPVIHLESIRRFARLQRRYGHWRLAWFENLLRCADALASADNNAPTAKEVKCEPS